DRKSTRLNSSHLVISYAVFCLKKKTKPYWIQRSRRRLGDGAIALENFPLQFEHEHEQEQEQDAGLNLHWALAVRHFLANVAQIFPVPCRRDAFASRVRARLVRA